MITRPIRLIGLLTALVLLAAACGGGAEETSGDAAGGASPDAATTDGGQASGEPITIGAVFDLSGATADVGTPFADGVRAYVDWLNSNGGVEGRPVELLSQDYAYEVPQAEQLYSQYVSEGAVAFSGWGTGDSEALRTRVTSDEIPFMSASYSEDLADPAETPYNFVAAATYSQQMRIALRHIADTNDGHVEVAVFHNDSPFGESPLEDGRAYIEEGGLDIGYQSYAMPSGATDYFGELAQAQDQGANYIIIQNVASPAAQLAQNVVSQGMDATIVCLNWCSDEIFIELAGDSATGSLGVIPFGPPTQADGDLGDVESYLESQGSSIDDISLHFTQGWYQFSLFIEAIRALVADGAEVTGPEIKTALEEMDPYDTPVTAEIDFAADSHAGMQAVPVYEVQDGAWATITDPITP